MKTYYKDDTYNTAVEKVVRWSEEDGLFIGSAPPIIGDCCHGVTEQGVLEELNIIIRDWIDNFQESLGDD